MSDGTYRGLTMRRGTKISIAFGITVLLCLSLSAALLVGSSGERTVLTVFVAGSLAEPFGNMPDGQDLEGAFESSHAGVDVQIISGGSAEIIRRITELGQRCDVLAVADHSLIPAMMINSTERSAEFVISFAKNSLVLAFTERSRYADELNASNWYDVLRRPDVKLGFSNPNDDPCGYRTQMLLILAEQYYGDDAIYEDLVMSCTNIEDILVSDNTTTIRVPSDLKATDSSRLMIRSAEVELTSALEAGSIDYLFIYESVARRHADSGIRYLELPREMNMNDTSLSSLYASVRLVQFADSPDPSRTKTVAGSPIVYGVTIPKNVEHPDLAIEFVRLLLGQVGQGIMRGAGQEPMDPPVAGYWKENVPEELRYLVV